MKKVLINSLLRMTRSFATKFLDQRCSSISVINIPSLLMEQEKRTIFLVYMSVQPMNPFPKVSTSMKELRDIFSMEPI